MSAAAIRALVSGYPRRRWRSKLLVMLQAFIDDSASNAGSHRLFLCAFMQTAETWIKFSEDWDQELQRAPAIEYFKMSEATSLGGQFRKWDRDERDKKIIAMAGVIAKHAPWGFHSSVSITEFNRILKPVSPFGMQTPYYPLFWAIIYGVAQLHERLGLDVPCDFIFDYQSDLNGKVLPLFEAVLSAQEERWKRVISGTPTFRTDHEVLPLQAADMLAWHVRRRESGNYPETLGGGTK